MNRRDFLAAGALATGGVLLSRAALAQAEAEPLFSFIALADPHLREDRQNEPTGVEKLQRALEAIRGLAQRPAFILLLGDIHPDKLEPFMGNWPAPVHPVHGNHENAAHREALRELFSSDFAGRDFYAFAHADCRFIGLCTALVGDHVGHFESEDITPPIGQVEFLEQELQQSQNMRGRFIFSHVPPEQHNKPTADCLGSHEAMYLHRLVQDRNVTACFFGHRHAARLYQMGQTAMYGVPSTNWNFGGKPVGFLQVFVHAEGIQAELIPS